MSKPTQPQPQEQARPYVQSQPENDAPPPSYDSHTRDRPYTPTSAGALVHSTLPLTRRPYGQHRQQVEIAEELIYGVAPDSVDQSTEPLCLTLDADLIYPTVPPSNAAYMLSHALTSYTSMMSLTFSRSIPWTARHGVRQKELYILTRLPLVHDTFEVKGLRRSTCLGNSIGELRFVRSGTLRRKEGACEFRFMGDAIVVKGSAGGQWEDVAGGRGIVATERDGQGGKKEIVFVEGVPEEKRDLVVVLWCAKVWFNIPEPPLSRREIARRVISGSQIAGGM